MKKDGPIFPRKEKSARFRMRRKTELLLGFFERYLTKFLHQFGQFQRSFASAGTGGFVAFFQLQSSVFLKIRDFGSDFLE